MTTLGDQGHGQDLNHWMQTIETNVANLVERKFIRTQTSGRLGNLSLKNKEERKARQPKIQPNLTTGLVWQECLCWCHHHWMLPRSCQSYPQTTLHFCITAQDWNSQGGISDWLSAIDLHPRRQEAGSRNSYPSPMNLRVTLRYPHAGQPVNKHLQLQVSGIRTSS